MSPEPPGPVLLADIGKTSIRVECRRPGGPPARARAAASGVLGEEGALGRLLAGFATALERLPAEARGAVTAAVGVAGYLSHPRLRAPLEQGLSGLLPGAELHITSDLAIAHIGALAGGDGTVLVAGTGAVALGVGPAGAALADGAGPLLGDEGGGYWIGSHGARAAIRAAQRRAPATALTAAAAAHFGRPATALPGWIADRPHPVRDLAGFAPEVLNAWEGGCAVAAEIAESAAGRLAESSAAARAAAGGGPIALAGSLFGQPRFRRLTEAEIRRLATGAEVIEAVGDPLDGAALICAATPHSLAAIARLSSSSA